MAKIRIFSEEKASNNMSSGLTWNNPAFYEFINVPDDVDVELMLALDYEDRLNDAREGDEVVKYETLQDYMDADNREHFNHWRKYNRHLGTQFEDDDVAKKLADNSISEERIAEQMDDEAVINKVLIVFKDKPEWANLVIEVVIKDKTIEQYAKDIGKDPSGVGKMLKRALKKLKEFF